LAVPIDLDALVARVPAHREFKTLAELRAGTQALRTEFPGLVRVETAGSSAEGRPVELVTVGHGRKSVLLVGVPHPNEPIGTLTIEFLCRLLCEDDALRAALDVTVHAILVADPDGYVLNEGWMKGAFSPLRYALSFYRPPHREQVEWSFPVDYKTLRFTTPSPETATVMRVMQRVRPQVFYSLHNAGFCGVYFYVSHARPALFEALHGLVARQGLALHRGEPEVPYLKTLAPATYELFTIRDTYEYLAKSLGPDEDPAAVIEAGTCADDWIRCVSDPFSLVCELPYYTAPALVDGTPSGRSRREVAREGLDRAAALHAECLSHFEALGGRAPDHRLTRSVVDYLAKTPKRLAAERAHAEGADYAREATKAEALDAITCRAFYHVVYQGEVHRLAALAGDAARAERVAADVARHMTAVERESALTVLPLRPLVAVQAGAGLAAIAASE
jgi:hypothetical protein